MIQTINPLDIETQDLNSSEFRPQYMVELQKSLFRYLPDSDTTSDKDVVRPLGQGAKRYICLNCNKVFQEKLWVKRKYCSRECYYNNQKNIPNSGWFKKGYIPPHTKTKEFAERISQLHKGKFVCEETRKKLSETKIRLFKEGKLKAWRTGLTKENDERVREAGKKCSKTKKEMYKKGLLISPFKGQHLFGEQNPNWNGGLSFEPYSPEFNKVLKEQIRKRDNYICKNCNKQEQENFMNTKRGIIHCNLHIHHIDYDKSNYVPDNLISLCNTCNSKANFNRNYWISYFQSKLSFNSVIGLP